MKFWNLLAEKSGGYTLELFGVIGKDFYSDEGVSKSEFDADWKTIPRDAQIEVLINSPGGNVWDGIHIFNRLQSRRDKVVCTVMGEAASIASVIALAGRETRMYENAALMIHCVWSYFAGNADDARKFADIMDQHDSMLADIYSKKTGISREEVLQMMRAETRMFSADAMKRRFCDALVEVPAIAMNFDLSRFGRVPVSPLVGNKTTPAGDGGADRKDNTVNKTAILALLEKHGSKLNENAKDEEILAAFEKLVTDGKVAKDEADKLKAAQKPASAPVPAPAVDNDHDARLKALEAARDAEREKRITSQIAALVKEGRVPPEQEQDCIKRAMKDESLITLFAALPIREVATPPVSAQITGEDPVTFLPHWASVPCNKEGMTRATLFARERDRVLPLMNTNTFPTQLKRQVILQESMRAFAAILVPLNEFSTVFSNVQLEGTDKLDIPYYALSGGSATAWNASNGYVAGNTTTSYKEVTIDQRYYVGAEFTSAEIRRLPYLNMQALMNLKAEDLANHVFGAILDLVVVGTFTNTASTGPASGFDYDDVVDIKSTCDNAMWPVQGRSLILASEYYNALLKDLKDAGAYGGSEPVRQGMVPTIAGFRTHGCPSFSKASTSYAAGLRGFAGFRSALLFGSSPIQPGDAVRQQLASYEIYTDPQTGISFEYKKMASAYYDKQTEIIEVNYGVAAGEAKAATLITTGS